MEPTQWTFITWINGKRKTGSDGKGGDSKGKGKGSRSKEGKGETEQGKRRKEDELRCFCCDRDVQGTTGQTAHRWQLTTGKNDSKSAPASSRAANGPCLWHSRRRIQC